MSTWRIIINRLVFIPFALLGVLAVTFVLLQVMPGNPVERLLGEHGVSDEVRDRLLETYGLDRPLTTRFFMYCTRILTGDFGRIPGTGRSVRAEFLERLPNTIRLALMAFMVSLTIGIPAGMLSALRAGTWTDSTVRTISTLFQATPIFWFGLILMYVIALQWRLLPASGDGGGALRHLMLPATTLGLRPAAFIQRIVRSSLLDVLGQDYIRTARAKGLSEFIIITRHALRNAAIPVITVLGVDLGSLLAGSVITESIFQYRGIGSFILYGIHNRIYDVVLISALFTTFIFIIVNALTDVCYVFLDPRVQHTP